MFFKSRRLITNGFITKQVTFEGVSAHAGISPHLGVNALNVYKNNFIELMNSEEGIIDEIKASGSTDFGDLSQIIPCLHPWVGGVTGNLHTKDYEISDEELAYIIPAKAMAMTVIDLLFDNAKLANEVINNYKIKRVRLIWLLFYIFINRILSILNLSILNK